MYNLYTYDCIKCVSYCIDIRSATNVHTLKWKTNIAWVSPKWVPLHALQFHP